MTAPILINGQKPDIFVDLDRTLLDTDQFIKAILRLLTDKFALDPEHEYGRAETEFTKMDDGLRRYHFWDHMASLGIPKDQVLGLQSQLAARKLLYPDALPALSYLSSRYRTSILTFGERDYQEFKLRCLPDIESFRAHIVNGHKAPVLAALPGPSVVIDDKEIPGLPPSVTLLLLDRSASEPIVRRSDQLIVITNLLVLEQIL